MPPVIPGTGAGGCEGEHAVSMLLLRNKESYSFGPRDWGAGKGRILRLACEEWDAATDLQPVIHDYESLVFVRVGALRLKHLGTRAGTGDLIHLAGGQVRALACDDGDCRLVLCSFRWQQAAANCAALFPRERPIIHIGPGSLVEEAIDRLMDEARAGMPDFHRASMLWLELLLLTLQRHQMPSEPAHRPRWQRFHAAQNHIQTHWAQITSTREAAEQLDMSHAYLCRLFKEFAAVTPYQFLMDLKIRAAADRLAVGEASIAQLTEELGFSHALVFARAFRRVMGETPGRFQTRFQ